MKKIYFAPETKEVRIALQHIIAASPGNVEINTGDTQVTDPDAIGSRGFGSLWDDED